MLNDITLIKIYFFTIYGYVLVALDYAEIPHKAFFVLCIIMMGDIATGFVKGYVFKELSSRPIVNGMIRKTGLLIAIYFIFLGVSVIPELGFIGNLALGMFILAELLSILGNIIAVREKQKVSEHDALILVTEIIKSSFKKMGTRK